MRVNIILLIIGHLQLETSEVLAKVWPGFSSVKVKPFINYQWPHDAEGIPLDWWVKYCTDSMLFVIVFFVLCRVAMEYSYRLFRVSAILFVYHLFDHFMLWYNYRTSHWAYWVFIVAVVACVVAMFLPDRRGKVVHLK